MTNELAIITGSTAIEQGKKLGTAIKSIRVRGKNLDRDIWSCAVSAAHHAQTYGDTGYLARLADAMSKGSRVQRLTGWVESILPLAFISNPITKKYKVLVSIDRETEIGGRNNWPIDAMLATAWYDYKSIPDATTFGIKELLDMLTKTEKGKSNGARVYSDDVKKLASTLAADAQEWVAMNVALCG
jgi:hypothetical protein